MLRFYRLDETGVALQENARVVSGFLKSESFAIRSQTGVILDEILFAQNQESGKTVYFVVRDPDFSGPATTGCASLALKFKLHAHGW